MKHSETAGKSVRVLPVFLMVCILALTLMTRQAYAGSSPEKWAQTAGVETESELQEEDSDAGAYREF